MTTTPKMGEWLMADFGCAFCDHKTEVHEALIDHIEDEHVPEERKSVSVYCGLPLQGRIERAHLYEWMAREEVYVAAKFDDQRQGHDESLESEGLEGFWSRQIVQYLDRAALCLKQAEGMDDDPLAQRFLQQKAQQAIVKSMMTAKGCVEASIRVFGELPAPGLNSGEVLTWPVPEGYSVP